MPVELGLWRIDGGLPKRLSMELIDREQRLEDLIEADIDILGMDVLILGRQIPTANSKFIDLLAIDGDGHLHVLELKRDRTPRDVVAQVLDYGAWVVGLTNTEVRQIWDDVHDQPFDIAFADRFGQGPPEALNEGHSLTIVAATLDPASERIVDYLTSEYGVPINVLFFQYMQDGDREYLGRSWLISPDEVEASTARRSGTGSKREPWNGQDFYVSFGLDHNRTWDDARRYGFISAGGGDWYVRTMRQLRPGHRVFVHNPGSGYLGVGEVTSGVVPAEEFEVEIDGETMPILKAPLKGDLGRSSSDHDEHLVGVRWVATRDEDAAFWTAGLFANRNTVCKLRSSFTLERLSKAFALDG